MQVERVNGFIGPRAKGNPAGVAVLDGPLEPARMLHVAQAVGFSETAFLWPESGGFRLRWFTPSIEIPLCGHATLASAHVLWSQRRLAKSETARFHTLSGLLTARRDGDWIELDFPAAPPAAVPVPPAIEAALGTKVKAAAKSTKWVLELADADAVESLRPDHAALKAAEGAVGVGVTARGQGPAPFDYVCRYFAPYAGVAEDPVTGSLQCALAPYWAPRLGKSEFLVRQASARGGLLRVRLVGDRVKIAGQAQMESPLRLA